MASVNLGKYAEVMTDNAFNHLDQNGHAHMVDVTPKQSTHRRAVARCKVMMRPATVQAVANREMKKGDEIGRAHV